VELTSEYQAGLVARKAAYKPSIRAVPNAYVIEKGAYCEPCLKCEQVCPTKAINLSEEDRYDEIQVGAIILAVGYRLYDPTPAEELGYGRYPNVVTGLQYERLASRSGPTEGIVERPSDGKIPERIAWINASALGTRNTPTVRRFVACTRPRKQCLPRAAARRPVRIFIMDERAFSKVHCLF
jgi:heterodisulfide reductase subunit A